VWTSAALQAQHLAAAVRTDLSGIHRAWQGWPAVSTVSGAGGLRFAVPERRFDCMAAGDPDTYSREASNRPFQISMGSPIDTSAAI
jgi:hypothetical protein